MLETVGPPGTYLHPALSPDETRLAVSPATKGQDIFVVPLAGDGKPIPVVQTPPSEVEPQLSPDGRWVAYVSNETGRQEVYVQPFPVTGAKWQVSSAGGRQPYWRGDGKDNRNVYVPSGDGQRFLVLMPLDAAASVINVVVNWTARLEQ